MNCCPPKPIWAIYVMVFFDIVGGAAVLIHGLSQLLRSEYLLESYVAAFTVPAGIMSIALGAMVWTGVRKGNDVYIFAFLVIRVAYLTYFTLAILILMTVAGASTGHIFGVLVTLIIIWILHYGVYEYYKELVNFTTSAHPGNIVVTYDNVMVAEESKMGEAAV